MSELMQITDNNYKAEVLDSKIPVLLDFWAEWCGPCKMIAPLVDEIAVEYKDKIKVCKMNVDDNPKVTGSLGITSIPTLIIYKDSEAVDRIVGAVPKNNIIQKIKQYI